MRDRCACSETDRSIPGTDGSTVISSTKDLYELSTGSGCNEDRLCGGKLHGWVLVEEAGLQFRDQEVKGLIDTISLWTGKVVIPKQGAVNLAKLTIVSDRKMPKGEALNLIFQAFRLNGLGVVETDEMILIDVLSEMSVLQPSKVLGPDVDVMPRHPE